MPPREAPAPRAGAPFWASSWVSSPRCSWVPLRSRDTCHGATGTKHPSLPNVRSSVGNASSTATAAARARAASGSAAISAAARPIAPSVGPSVARLAWPATSSAPICTPMRTTAVPALPRAAWTRPANPGIAAFDVNPRVWHARADGQHTRPVSSQVPPQRRVLPTPGPSEQPAGRAGRGPSPEEFEPIDAAFRARS
jgi:hypothetical protein